MGEIGVGGSNPIRLQSMTTTSTRDVPGTVEQIMRLADTGCEIARVTVQGKQEAAACERIKSQLLQKGYTIPLVADIHFYPQAAMQVADFVDKVRVNPGNFVDKRASFKVIDYTDQSYKEELKKIEDTFGPLVEKCSKLKKAIRIGTNHGSLSDRIMNRYGDTPLGMVESALEFARVCRKLHFHDIIFSMKASNPVVMIQAYRLLVAKMMTEDWDYPLHLGVTEAGVGEDGRVKSAVGIGSLLLDGIGDTIRVSLTEDPWHEIDPAKRLVDLAKSYVEKETQPFTENKRNFMQIKRRDVSEVPPLHRDGSVILARADEFSSKIADAFYNGKEILSDDQSIPVVDLAELKSNRPSRPNKLNEHGVVVYVKDGGPVEWTKLKGQKVKFVLLECTHSLLHQGRRFYQWLAEEISRLPLILVGDYTGCSKEDTIIRASAELGALLSDGIGEGIVLRADFDVRSLSFNILQGCRMRATKTEFIACPSCGRTLFNLQEVTQRIREKTAHLPGVKVAIMGCIVNGPGEMADADFGYVGSGPDKIDLYVGKERVKRGIHYSIAVECLIDLIKEHDRWIEPKSENVL